MKTPAKNSVPKRVEKASERVRELREYVEGAPVAGTYRSEHGRDERVTVGGSSQNESAPADTRPEVAEKYEP